MLKIILMKFLEENKENIFILFIIQQIYFNWKKKDLKIFIQKNLLGLDIFSKIITLEIVLYMQIL